MTDRWNVTVEKEILYRLPQRDDKGTPPQGPAHTRWVLPLPLSFSFPGNSVFLYPFSPGPGFAWGGNLSLPPESVPLTQVWATPNTALLSPAVSTLPATCPRCTDNLALPRSCAHGWQMHRAQGSSRLGAFTCLYGSGFWFQNFVSSFWASVVNSFKNHFPNLGMRYTEIVLR